MAQSKPFNHINISIRDNQLLSSSSEMMDGAFLKWHALNKNRYIQKISCFNTQTYFLK